MTARSAADAQLRCDVARVGLEVRRARADLGITQAELARRMGVKPPYIASIEAGTRNITVGQLANLADALGRGLDIRIPAIKAEHLGRSASRGSWC